MDEIRPGRYRHFKGNEYEVLCLARHSETQEPMVVYRALYGERGVWVRPASMWAETVERDGKTHRRFTYIGEAEKLAPYAPGAESAEAELSGPADAAGSGVKG